MTLREAGQAVLATAFMLAVLTVACNPPSIHVTVTPQEFFFGLFGIIIVVWSWSQLRADLREKRLRRRPVHN